MVANGGAEQVSNAYPVSRVADVLVGYNTVVAGSAAAGVIIEALKAPASLLRATPRARKGAAATGRQRFAGSPPRRGFAVSLPRRGFAVSLPRRGFAVSLPRGGRTNTQCWRGRRAEE